MRCFLFVVFVHLCGSVAHDFEHRDVVVRLGKLLLVVQGHRTVHDGRLLATRAANISHARHIRGQPAAWGCLALLSPEGAKAETASLLGLHFTRR